MYKTLVFVCLCSLDFTLCLYKGQPCILKGQTREVISGVCKEVLECPYALKVISEDEKRPTLCGYDDKTAIACCPTRDISYTTGLLNRYFIASNEGVLRSADMTCRYEGREPLLCCRNKPDKEVLPEPLQCPTLPRPRLRTDAQHFAWEKCIEYQRYFNKCIELNDYAHRFERVNTCPSSGFRISGGTPAALKEFPHMAVIGCTITKTQHDNDIIWVGGGSLLSDKFILTAAHVIIESPYGNPRYALLGTINKKNLKDGLLVNIVRIIPHKLYVTGEKKHDIALLELNERVEFNEFIRPICLPVPGREIDNARIIAGWGETDEQGKSSDELLTAMVYEDSNLCKMRFENRAFIPDTMICARGNVGSLHIPDACKGDSGGPLMAAFNNLNCSYSIEGVVSFGPRCGQAAGVYTKVEKYLDWIIKNVWPKEFNEYRK